MKVAEALENKKEMKKIDLNGERGSMRSNELHEY